MLVCVLVCLTLIKRKGLFLCSVIVTFLVILLVFYHFCTGLSFFFFFAIMNTIFTFLSFYDI